MVSTPNMAYVPEFPAVHSDGFFIREDGTWGPHEYSIWPQMFSSYNIHHACIPLCPLLYDVAGISDKNSLGYCSLIWSEFPKSDWNQLGENNSSDTTLHTGQFNDSVKNALKQEFLLCCERARSRYKSSEFKEDGDMKLVETLVRMGEKVLERVESTPEPYYGSLGSARELQRLTLELLGFINLCDTVRPRIRNPTFKATTVLPYRGSFTNTPDILQDLYRVGIPVWYVRDKSSIGPTTKIFSVAQPVPVTLALKIGRPSLRGQPLFLGDIPAGQIDLRAPNGQMLSDTAMTDLIHSMRCYSRAALDVRKLWPPLHQTISPSSSTHGPQCHSGMGPPPTTAPASSSKRPLVAANSATGSDRPTKRGKAAHGTVSGAPSGSLVFSIPDGLVPGTRDVPPISKYWFRAITNAGVLVKKRPNDPAMYHHPPPFLFDPHDTERLARYLHNYVRIECFLRQRMKEGSMFSGQAYTIRQWRDVLFGDYIQSKEIDPQTTSEVVRKLSNTLAKSSSSINPDVGSSRMHDRKKRGRAAEIRVTFAVQGRFEPYSSDMETVWWMSGEKVSIADIKSKRRLRTQILWDVHATGFIHDLWTIDLKLVPRNGLSPAQALERNQLVASVYGGAFENEQGQKGYTLSPSKMMNFWSDSPNVKSLDSFVRVLKGWGDCPKVLRDVDVMYCAEGLRDVIYERSVSFFIDICITVHDRLPTIPCYLESM